MNQPLTHGRDPVCGMEVELAHAEHHAAYRGTTFHFCSAQCRERFEQNPGLYAGARRIADIEPMLKRHTLRLATGEEAALRALVARLAGMMGVEAAEASGRRLKLGYDLRLVSLEQIEAAIAETGLQLKGGLHGLRRGLWKFSEANELSNAARPGTGACCNRPPTRLR